MSDTAKNGVCRKHEALKKKKKRRTGDGKLLEIKLSRSIGKANTARDEGGEEAGGGALLTQTGVVSEELGEPLAVFFAVAAVAAVAERRHANFRGTQVVRGHDGTCGGEIHGCDF